MNMSRYVYKTLMIICPVICTNSILNSGKTFFAGQSKCLVTEGVYRVHFLNKIVRTQENIQLKKKYG